MAACCLLSFGPIFFSLLLCNNNAGKLWWFMNEATWVWWAYLSNSGPRLWWRARGVEEGGNTGTVTTLHNPYQAPFKHLQHLLRTGRFHAHDLRDLCLLRGEGRAGSFPACTCLIACRRHPTPSWQNALMATRLSVCIRSRRPEFGARLIFFFFFPQLVSTWRFENLPRFLPHGVRRQNLRCVVKIIIPPVRDMMSLWPSVRLAIIYACGVRSRCSSLLCFMWKKRENRRTCQSFPLNLVTFFYLFSSVKWLLLLSNIPMPAFVCFFAKCTPWQVCEQWAGLRWLWYEEIKR